MNLDELASRIKRHIQTDYFTLREIIELYDLFPTCRYEGSAVRVCLDKNIAECDFSLSKNLYWSKTEEGIVSYFKNSVKTAPNKVFYLKGEILGVDLNLLVKYINENSGRSDLINPYSGEEEILAYKLKVLSPQN